MMVATHEEEKSKLLQKVDGEEELDWAYKFLAAHWEVRTFLLFYGQEKLPDKWCREPEDTECGEERLLGTPNQDCSDLLKFLQ